MHSARYLIRFDDICPTMNWRIWAEIEACLCAFNVRPIVSIVPCNRDRKLISDIARSDFWERVREWQAKGWAVGLHGYQHRQFTTNGGIININNKSEFAGVDHEVQRQRLISAVQVFAAEGVRIDTWVAPWHSFDDGTLAALKSLGIDCVSDGYRLYPWRDGRNMLWVPQQLWRFRPIPPGVWTVCIHHNDWTSRDLLRFARGIARFHRQICSLEEIKARKYQPTLWGGLANFAMDAAIRLKKKCLHGAPRGADEAGRFITD